MEVKKKGKERWKESPKRRMVETEYEDEEFFIHSAQVPLKVSQELLGEKAQTKHFSSSFSSSSFCPSLHTLQSTP